MKKALFWAAMAFHMVFIGTADLSHAISVSSGRPLLAIQGTTRADISYDIIALCYDSGLNKLDVTLNNWSPSQAGYLYSEGDLFIPGVRVSLFMGPESTLTRVFDGTITACAVRFPGDRPSSLTFTAICSSQPAMENQISVAIGSDLLSFDPVLAAVKDVIECTGMTQGMPDLRPGTVLTIAGAGTRFSRSYYVSKTIHTFDLNKGYTTGFSASTRPPGLAPGRPHRKNMNFKRSSSLGLSVKTRVENTWGAGGRKV